VLRAALYQQAFNPGRAGTDPGPAATGALAWARHHSLPLAALADPQVTRRALEALAVRLDGTRAAATTITRKRAVFRTCLGYAAELGLLAADPVDRISWRPPRSSRTVDPRSAATPAQVQAILAEVTRIRPELTAFFGCLYYAALRTAEAIALHADSCDLPPAGWGQLTLTASLPRSARAWTGNGTPREPRSLKLRPQGTIRTVPIPPQLVRLLREHLQAYGCAEDGRLFQSAPGGPLSESLYGRIWHQARAAAALPAWPTTPPARRPYDLRHAALSLWLASGAPPAEVAARAGHSVRVLLTIYAHCIPGHDLIAGQQIEQALHTQPSGPRMARKYRRRTGGSCPSCVRVTAGPCRTQLVHTPAASTGKSARDLQRRPEETGSADHPPADAQPRAPIPRKPLTRPDLAHNWPTATVNGLPDRPRTHHRPGSRQHRHHA